jgi:hypothetical protein
MAASTPMRIGKRSLKEVSSTTGKSDLYKEEVAEEGKANTVDGICVPFSHERNY